MTKAVKPQIVYPQLGIVDEIKEEILDKDAEEENKKQWRYKL